MCEREKSDLTHTFCLCRPGRITLVKCEEGSSWKRGSIPRVVILFTSVLGLSFQLQDFLHGLRNDSPREQKRIHRYIHIYIYIDYIYIHDILYPVLYGIQKTIETNSRETVAIPAIKF